jgi:hypothetical protein
MDIQTPASPIESLEWYAEYAALRGQAISLSAAQRRYRESNRTRVSARAVKRAIANGHIRVLWPSGFVSNGKPPHGPIRVDESHVALAARLWAIADRASVAGGLCGRPRQAAKPSQ